MRIGANVLPSALAADLQRGGRTLSPEEVTRLKKLLRHVRAPLPVLYSREAIEREHDLWTSESAKFYLGAESELANPGRIDPAQVLIGEAEPDSPIALDFRTTPPRVIYLGDIGHESYWFELRANYCSFVAAVCG